jgi:very-short-patch-repair endonuclease
MTADGPISLDIERFSAHRQQERRPDRLIAQVAEEQHGVISLAQLGMMGLTTPAVQQRAETGRLHRVYQGVYAVGYPLLERKGHWMAAVLACGPEAVLSHRSAAALWGLGSWGRAKIDVTAAGRRGRSPSGIDSHRHDHLRHQDKTVVQGIPCTTVARTLLDLAGVVRIGELRNAIAQAEILRVFDLTSRRVVIGRSRGRRGVARLRLAIDEHDPGSERANPGLERTFLAICRRANLPAPQVNVPVDLPDRQIVADFLWRDRRLIVETDDRRSHQTASAFERDRRRDQQLTLAGWRVIRCTWRQVTDEPEALMGTLRALLSPTGRFP